jgi:hypothetical protein
MITSFARPRFYFIEGPASWSAGLGPSDDICLGAGVFSLNLHRSEMGQIQHFGLRAVQT